VSAPCMSESNRLISRLIGEMFFWNTLRWRAWWQRMRRAPIVSQAGPTAIAQVLPRHRLPLHIRPKKHLEMVADAPCRVVGRPHRVEARPVIRLGRVTPLERLPRLVLQALNDRR